ncbi:MAG: hypothetical protein ACLFV2_10655, partial [Desulfurivibrionaceae bacterium]
MQYSATSLINLHGSFARKREQKVSGGRHKKRNQIFYKTIGAMALLAMFSGLAFSLWFGSHVDRNLKQLAEARQAVSQIKDKNHELQQQKNRLFSKERVQANAAVKLNLFPSKESKQDGREGVR